MVFPREREDGGAFRVRLRKEIEVKLRSRRFYCEVQRGLCTGGHKRCVLHVVAAMVYRGDWAHRWPVARVGRRAWRPFIPTAQWSWLVHERGERGSYTSNRQSAGYQNIAMELKVFLIKLGAGVNQLPADHAIA